MSRLPLGEVFGFPVTDLGDTARRSREDKHCPFRGNQCTKSSKTDPVGTCSLSTGTNLVTICPVRFLEAQRVFLDVARLAFGRGTRFVAAPEVRVLRVENASGKAKKIGKVDFLIAKVADDDAPIDFAALEVQAVYFSGKQIRSAVKEFLKTGHLPESAYRRPDWRSSIQKRLMPQLSLKVPIFRRWGKKFFVATDSVFFDRIPPFRNVDSMANSEITWLVYPFVASGAGNYVMEAPAQKYSLWEDVASALREGIAPEPEEVLQEIASKQRNAHLRVFTA